MTNKLAAGELENLVLDVLWSANEPMIPREVHRAIREHRPLAYTTVMTILVRLCQKDVVDRRQQGRAFAYWARLSREERAATRMSDVLARAGDTSLALAHFVGSLPPNQQAELRRVLRRPQIDR